MAAFFFKSKLQERTMDIQSQRTTDEPAARPGQIDPDKLAAMTKQLDAAFARADKALVDALNEAMRRTESKRAAMRRV